MTDQTSEREPYPDPWGPDGKFVDAALEPLMRSTSQPTTNSDQPDRPRFAPGSVTPP